MKQRLRTDCTIETDDYIVTYDCTDESFDHEFGTEKAYGYDITSVAVYLPIIQDYIDYDLKVTSEISKIIDRAVESDIADKSYFEEVEPNDFEEET